MAADAITKIQIMSTRTSARTRLSMGAETETNVVKDLCTCRIKSIANREGIEMDNCKP